MDLDPSASAPKERALTPELQKIYDDLRKEIDIEVKKFWDKKQGDFAQAAELTAKQAVQQVLNQQAAAQPKTGPGIGAPQLPANKSLPWFANGIRSFIRKLWHGDSASNPDWHDMPAWKWNKKEHFSLSEYNNIREELQLLVTEDAGGAANDIEEFVNVIMSKIMKAIQLSRPILKPRNKPTPTPSVAPTPPATSPTASPTPPAEEPPTPEPITTEPTEEPIEPKPDTNPKINPIGNDAKVLPSGNSEKHRQEAAGKLIDVVHELNSLRKEIDSKPPHEDKEAAEKHYQDVEEITKNRATAIAQRAGVKLTNAGFVEPKIDNFKKLVSIMRDAAEIPGSSLSSWDEYHLYLKYFDIKRSAKRALEAAIKDVMAETVPVETSNYLVNKYRNNMPIWEQKIVLKNALKESKKENTVIMRAKKLPITAKVKVFKESLQTT